MNAQLARVTSLLEQQVLSKERLEKHVQGFVSWAKGGLAGMVDPYQAENALRYALEQAGIPHRLASQEKQNIKHKIWGKIWIQEFSS